MTREPQICQCGGQHEKCSLLEAALKERDELKSKGESLCHQNGQILVENHTLKRERDNFQQENTKCVAQLTGYEACMQHRHELRAQNARLEGILNLARGECRNHMRTNWKRCEHPLCEAIANLDALSSLEPHATKETKS